MEYPFDSFVAVIPVSTALFSKTEIVCFRVILRLYARAGTFLFSRMVYARGR